MHLLWAAWTGQARAPQPLASSVLLGTPHCLGSRNPGQSVSCSSMDLPSDLQPKQACSEVACKHSGSPEGSEHTQHIGACSCRPSSWFHPAWVSGSQGVRLRLGTLPARPAQCDPRETSSPGGLQAEKVPQGDRGARACPVSAAGSRRMNPPTPRLTASLTRYRPQGPRLLLRDVKDTDSIACGVSRGTGQGLALSMKVQGKCWQQQDKHSLWTLDRVTSACRQMRLAMLDIRLHQEAGQRLWCLWDAVP